MLSNTLKYPLQLFSAYGIELEYMIVDKDSGSVCPAADYLLQLDGIPVNELEKDPISWSNELASHVFELKTTAPNPDLSGMEKPFLQEIALANKLLAKKNACLMPSGMHPWMDPYRELKLWPHGDRQIYQAFDKIFDCRGHGWANLQSCHLNLPFGDEVQFVKLHAAVRAILPLLPALAASSPLIDGHFAPYLDMRLETYRHNARKVPSVSGHVIPEICRSYADYEELILGKIYADLAPLDPEGILRAEWTNARGAIARFERGSIEIRLLDVQECPASDLAIAALVVAVLKSLTEELWQPIKALHELSGTDLAHLLQQTIEKGEQADVVDPTYLKVFGMPSKPIKAQELWQLLASKVPLQITASLSKALEVILDQGPLARRIVNILGPTPDRSSIAYVYQALCRHLADGIPFQP